MNLKDLRYVDLGSVDVVELIEKDFGDSAFYPCHLSHFCHRPYKIQFRASTNF